MRSSYKRGSDWRNVHHARIPFGLSRSFDGMTLANLHIGLSSRRQERKCLCTIKRDGTVGRVCDTCLLGTSLGPDARINPTAGHGFDQRQPNLVRDNASPQKSTPRVRLERSTVMDDSQVVYLREKIRKAHPMMKLRSFTK